MKVDAEFTCARCHAKAEGKAYLVQSNDEEGYLTRDVVVDREIIPLGWGRILCGDLRCSKCLKPKKATTTP